MNTAYCKSKIVTIMVILAILATITTTLHHRRLLPGSASRTQAGPVLPATAYSDLVNGLSMGGR